MLDQELSELPILDRSQLETMTGGDIDLSLEVVDIFNHQAEIWARMLDPRSETRQWADAAHTLKGAGLSIGAMRLSKACERAEKAGRSDTPPSVTGAAVLLADVKDILGDTLQATARLLHELESSRKAS